MEIGKDSAASADGAPPALGVTGDRSAGGAAEIEVGVEHEGKLASEVAIVKRDGVRGNFQDHNWNTSRGSVKCRGNEFDV